MHPAAVTLPVPPLAAIETGLFLLAAPLLLLMCVWATVTAFRILVPEQPLSVDRRARRRGVAAPVRARDIVAEQRRRPAPVFDAGTSSESESIAESLWARRN